MNLIEACFRFRRAKENFRILKSGASKVYQVYDLIFGKFRTYVPSPGHTEYMYDQLILLSLSFDI